MADKIPNFNTLVSTTGKLLQNKRNHQSAASEQDLVLESRETLRRGTVESSRGKGTFFQSVVSSGCIDLVWSKSTGQGWVSFLRYRRGDWARGEHIHEQGVLLFL